MDERHQELEQETKSRFVEERLATTKALSKHDNRLDDFAVEQTVNGLCSEVALKAASDDLKKQEQKLIGVKVNGNIAAHGQGNIPLAFNDNTLARWRH